MRSAFAAAAVLIGCAAFSGCATVYRTPGSESVPVEGMGVLRHVRPVASHFVIESVDGQWRGLGSLERYELTPGPHTVTVAVNRYGYTGGKITLRFYVEPGGAYRIEGTVDTAVMKWGVLIVDEATQKRIDY